jgi:hypothetical protein
VAAVQHVFAVSGARFASLRTAVEAALRAGDWRLNRNPFHFAGLLHSRRSRTWRLLCRFVERGLGLDLAQFVDVPDDFGYTARQYAGDDLFRSPAFDIAAAAKKVGDASRKADKVMATETKSKLIKPRPQPQQQQQQQQQQRKKSSSAEIHSRWMEAGEFGGWDVGDKRCVCLRSCVRACVRGRAGGGRGGGCG